MGGGDRGGEFFKNNLRIKLDTLFTNNLELLEIESFPENSSAGELMIWRTLEQTDKALYSC